ncbi:M1 family metallopeptidase [Erythrobacter sp. SCSIO 43205]|uniref:M1 family metallopeptidase n=1 Tax=Erythrobacter sp. SCSIO 43205 TaxID=2779361 RepID=UPI002104FBE1|nr:M1 family metallopeptidase [Erythrobacter sp. SCSIO 43205]
MAGNARRIVQFTLAISTCHQNHQDIAMRAFIQVLLLPCLFLIAGCGDLISSDTGTRGPIAPILTSKEAFDDQTFAKPQEARVTHLDLDLAVDFEAKTIGGTAVLDVLASQNAEEIILDSNGLRISAVTDEAGNDLAFALGDTVEGKGEPLTIQLPAQTLERDASLAEGELAPTHRITIEYMSAPQAEALQWLSPEQTAGGEYPFLFSQGQAINNRTWIPTQDSPGIRQTWEATISAPEPLNVVMSGVVQGDPQEEEGSRRAFSFVMNNAVPPYLIAIAAGNIEFRELGPRSGVWAEPEVIEAAAQEVGDTEALIDAGIALFGDYRWGRYDMIVLPPAFPYGGMENPVMTFLTPTFIAGDRSNNGLVAHELAHSWSGNLTTYSSWRDGWLNEGVTSYFENRIVEEVYGKKRAEQEYALSYAGLVEGIENAGADNPATAMRTPDEISPFATRGFAIYDKGTIFLRTVENIIGRETFDAWLTQWFDSHAFQPVTSEMFLADLREKLIKGDAELEEQLMLDEWVYGTGLPANASKPDPQAFAEVDNAVAAYANAGTLPEGDVWRGWTAAEQRRFLEELPDELSAEQLAALDNSLGLSQSANNEVLFLWLEAALRNQYDPAVPQAERFLAKVGRNKFVSPLFTALNDTAWGKPIAERIYAKTRSGYHAYTRSNVDATLQYEEPA